MFEMLNADPCERGGCVISLRAPPPMPVSTCGVLPRGHWLWDRCRPCSVAVKATWLLSVGKRRSRSDQRSAYRPSADLHATAQSFRTWVSRCPQLPERLRIVVTTLKRTARSKMVTLNVPIAAQTGIWVSWHRRRPGRARLRSIRWMPIIPIPAAMVATVLALKCRTGRTNLVRAGECSLR